MLDHVSLGVSDLKRAAAFYDAALAPLGHVRIWTGEHGVEYGPPGSEGRLALFTVRDRAASPAGFHVALTAPSQGAVDAFHAAALSAGGRDAGAPGPRPRYGDGYDAAFVLDPDGHKVEAVCHG